jgi:Ca2+-binding RTX toxin-like protein
VFLMAIFRIYDSAYISYDLNNSAAVTKATDSHIRVTDNAGGVINFYGIFLYNNSGLDGGTIQAVNIFRNGSKLFEIKGAAFDMLDMVSAVDSGGIRAGIEYMMSGNDKVYGASRSDKLFSYEGDDFINGRAGSDKMKGGEGDDTYVVDNKRDKAIELSGEGVDTVKSSVNFSLTSHLENLFLKGKSDLKATGNGEDNQIIGNRGDNVLKGLAGDDTLDGKSGSDKMKGGAGNDAYHVDHVGDRVIELAGEGIDSVFSQISYTLPKNVENLTLIGTENLFAVGNEEANEITGNQGNNILSGGLGDDILSGGLGADTFVWDKPDIPVAGVAVDIITDFDAADGDIIDLADLLSDSSHTIEAFAAPDSVGGGQHLQLSIKNGASAEVQTINISNVAVTSDVDATNIMNTLLSSGAIDDGI